jgi:prepilin-type N-terminal cleavage/methylation domain-containing protein
MNRAVGLTQRTTYKRWAIPTLRSGYTLLEVLLALGIALVLLGGLYVSMDVQIRLAQAGRERIEESSLARALLAKIGKDVSAALTPIRASQAATGSGGVAASGSTTTSSSSSSSSTPSPDSSTDEGTTNLNVVTPFNGGVQGAIDQLTLFTNRVPGVGKTDAEMDSAPNGGADVRRITYWLAGDAGLARQEITRLSGEDEGTRLPPDVKELESFIMAREVVGLEFRYFDGTGWVEQWDGTLAGDDGATPVGPPRAVKIVLRIASPQDRNRIKEFTHVVAIQAANAQPVAPTTTPEVTP